MPPASIRSDGKAALDPKLSRPAQVAEAIKDYIVRERLQPGDRLPSEPELIERFAMAKGTIREALRLLDAQGLVKSRTGPGGGTFVHEVSPERAAALLANYFYFKDLTISDIYQLRRVLEPELVASLAGKLPPRVIDRLRAIVATYSAPAETDEEERDQHIATLRFHKLLAEQSSNPLLSFLIGFMLTILTDITVYRRLYTPRLPPSSDRGAGGGRQRRRAGDHDSAHANGTAAHGGAGGLFLEAFHQRLRLTPLRFQGRSVGVTD